MKNAFHYITLFHYRERVDELKEQLRQKEVQLDTYMQTNRNLEGDVKWVSYRKMETMI